MADGATAHPIVYCFNDLAVRIVWITRDGHVTREMTVQADTTLKLIGPTEWISNKALLPPAGTR